MTEAIDQARNLIEARLRELSAERERLAAALNGLGASSPSPEASTRPARRRRKRAPKGRRRSQLLAAAKAHPGASAAQLAKRIGISTNQAYALAARLHKEGELAKSGRGYRIATTEATAPPTAPRRRRAKRAQAKKSPTKARRPSPAKARGKKSAAKASRPSPAKTRRKKSTAKRSRRSSSA